jgi:2-polyprenyl-3-methyl-5-hydroxy-6-metoxy-1,4-benzoquinol methylase
VREENESLSVGADALETALHAEPERSQYDSGSYYRDDGSATRLSRVFTPLLHLLDVLRVRTVMRGSGVESGAVLDIGAGDGRFLLAMRHAGFDVAGTSASRLSCAAAARRGIHLHETFTLPPELGDRQYDLLTYWHVFEHLEQPETHIPRWPELLAPGGCLVLEVPNLDSLGARICYDSWLGSDAEYHVNRVHEASLVAVLEQMGLTVIRRQWFSLKFSFIYAWSALLGWLTAGRYDFDAILTVLQRPRQALVRRPIRTLNTLASIVYLAPAWLVVVAAGGIRGQGEVVRIYARKPAQG